MDNVLIYRVGSGKAGSFAADQLRDMGIGLVDHPTPEVTHLLLDVPSFDDRGNLRCGEDLQELLRMLPAGLRVIGGNLCHPVLEGYPVWDLLKDADYAAKNAAITAECALGVAGKSMAICFRDASVLVSGWGRIGKCLALLLKAVGSHVTVAARKEEDRAMARALGLEAVDFPEAGNRLASFSVLFNTVPCPVFREEDCARAGKCLKIELASAAGIPGHDVIQARGLPGRCVPESAGALIAQTIWKKLQEG